MALARSGILIEHNSTQENLGIQVATAFRQNGVRVFDSFTNQTEAAYLIGRHVFDRKHTIRAVVLLDPNIIKPEQDRGMLLHLIRREHRIPIVTWPVFPNAPEWIDRQYPTLEEAITLLINQPQHRERR